MDAFKLDVAMIASTDACFELASIGAHLPRDLEPGLAYRDALALPPPTCCSYATFDAQVRPCLCAAGLTVHAEAQGSPSPIDATLVVNVMSIRISSITPPWLAPFVINAVKYYRKVSEVAHDWG